MTKKTVTVQPSPTFFYILIRHWKSWEWLEKCLDSVLSQNYPHYQILFVDDASEYTRKQQSFIRQKLAGHVVIFQPQRRFSLFNGCFMLNRYAHNPLAVVVSLDGDDWLSEPTVFEYLDQIYRRSDPWCTYGDCDIWDGQQTLPTSSLPPEVSANQPYPAAMIRAANYRQTFFRPLHPLTWKVELFRRIDQADFLRDGSWLRFAQDQALFFPMLEMSGERALRLTQPLATYNASNPRSEARLYLHDELRDELYIRTLPTYAAI